MSTRAADHEARPAMVKIIETVHIEADSADFKSVVQRLTGRDAVAGGLADGSSEQFSEEAAAQGVFTERGLAEKKVQEISCTNSDFNGVMNH